MENNINNSNSKDNNNITEIEEDKNYNENLVNTKNNSSSYHKYKKYLFFFMPIIFISLIIFLLIYLKYYKKIECEIGPENTCLTCERDKCASCNIGYLLIHGKCEINYSFKAIYFTSTNNTNIKLINNDYLNTLIEMNIDGKKVSKTDNYTFNDSG